MDIILSDKQVFWGKVIHQSGFREDTALSIIFFNDQIMLTRIRQTKKFWSLLTDSSLCFLSIPSLE